MNTLSRSHNQSIGTMTSSEVRSNLKLRNREPAPEAAKATGLKASKALHPKKPIRRKLEAMVGMPLLDFYFKREQKHCNLVGPKQVYLPRQRIPMYYYERKAVLPKDKSVDQQDIPTLLFCHGIGSSALEFFSLLRRLNVPPQVRILIPENIGHGEDLKRAISSESFHYPSPSDMVEATSEFLDVVNVSSNCNAMGGSLGGGIVYYLRIKRPEIIQNTVLVAPALLSVLDNTFLEGLSDGSNSFLEYGSRDDVKEIFRNLLWTGADQQRLNPKKDPIPKFIYEVLYRQNRKAPEGHWKSLQEGLLKDAIALRTTSKDNVEINPEDDGDNIFLATIDKDQDSRRVVVWPEEDQICKLEKGRRFFEASVSSGKCQFETLPDCGHIFHANGSQIYDIAAPKIKDFLLDFWIEV